MPANILDVFKGDAFDVYELTESINMMGNVPSRLGDMGIFRHNHLSTKHCVIERDEHTVSLIESTARGAPGKKQRASSRDARAIEIPHFPLDDAIEADDLVGVRAFGKDAQVLKTVASETAKRLRLLKNSHDATHEYLRAGAIKGVVLDGDASTTLLDLFTIFGITQKVIAFDLSNATLANIKSLCDEVTTHIEDGLGSQTYTGITALCGRTFWREFVSHGKVETAYDRYKEGSFLRDGNRTPFEAFGINWERYGAKIGSTAYVPDTDVRFVATGVDGLFASSFAPANWIEAVGTPAKEFYAKQIPKKDNSGIELLSQTNVISYCTRPQTLVRGHNGP